MTDVVSWFEIPSPFDTAPGSVLLADPPTSNPRKLRAMLLDGSYPKPFVIDDDELLTLYFNIHLIQSVMRIDTPNTLELRYTRTMMSFLLFNPQPARIVQIGLGGGSLLKFCHEHLPDCRLTAIELDADVIALRDVFRIPPDSQRMEIRHGDGAAYLAATRKSIDVLLIDAFDVDGFAQALASRQFLDTAHARLADRGQLVINLAGDKKRYQGLVAEVADVFAGRVVVLPVRGDGNAVLLAFKEPKRKTLTTAYWRRMQTQAKALKDQYDLDFPHFATLIERAWAKDR